MKLVGCGLLDLQKDFLLVATVFVEFLRMYVEVNRPL